jgi:NAD(P)-dependent dehydrogenase (short-subunit alcohol dehydrogenase family)
MATALVTGTSGIGLAAALALARAGHVVAATMRNLDRAGDLRQIAAKEQLAIDIEALDVDASVRSGFAAIAVRHGPSTFWSTMRASRAAARSRRRRSTSFAA